MEELGDSTSLAEQIELIRERDERDETRDVAPLRPADDAIQVDTSDLLIEQVLQTLLETVQSRTSE